MSFLKRIRYNSPVILSFSLLATAIFLFDILLGGHLMPYFTLSPHFNFSSIWWYFSLFTYTLGHVSLAHLFGNISFILLLGPILEEKYGSKTILLMMAFTAFFTAIINNLLFNTGIIGASGIVFMMIILVSFVNTKGSDIPLTFIFILILYLGKEVFNAFENDSTSQFAHIMGGVVGAVFGFTPYIKKKINGIIP